MKKFFLMLFFASLFFVSVNAIVLRGTHKLCKDEVEITLYQTGKMVYFDGTRTYTGSYTLENGYLYLLDENGDQIFACKYGLDQSKQKLLWITISGVKLTRC